MRLDKGGLRLFRLFGIDVFVHWSWAVVALIELQSRRDTYTSQAWNVAEYLALFAIVLLHEFGHALACRSVGGTADRIMLWPLGGVAYIAPPPRPGAVLWSSAAGPLVNLALLPITAGLYYAFGKGAGAPPDVAHFFLYLAAVNAGLLVFNLLPSFPLDGGQILRALLWYLLGAYRSLKVASVVGMLGAVALLGFAVTHRSKWLALMAGFAALRSWQGFRVASIPRRAGVACPRCQAEPPMSPSWICPCGARFDTFGALGACPTCRRAFDKTACTECNQVSAHHAWYPAAAPDRA
jgi:Zn-dependent protease